MHRNYKGPYSSYNTGDANPKPAIHGRTPPRGRMGSPKNYPRVFPMETRTTHKHPQSNPSVSATGTHAPQNQHQWRQDTRRPPPTEDIRRYQKPTLLTEHNTPANRTRPGAGRYCVTRNPP